MEVDKTFLERQKHILQIFYRINQRDHRFPEYEEIGKTFSIYEHADNYNVSIINKFVIFSNNMKFFLVSETRGREEICPIL